MVINDGGEAALKRCMDLIEANPHPEHLAEYEAIWGVKKGIKALLDDSIAQSAIVACEEKDGEAMIGGVALLGFIKYEIWLLTTAGAGRFPRWMIRSARRHLAAFDRFIGVNCSFYQRIPARYREGVAFARHMGFRETMRFEPEHNGKTIVTFERAVPPRKRED